MFRKFALFLLAATLIAVSGCDCGKDQCGSKSPCATCKGKSCDASCTKDGACCCANDVVVKIDGKPAVTMAEVNRIIDMNIGPYAQQIPADQLAGIKESMIERVIEQLTMQKLLLREAEKQKITVSDADIEAFFAERLPPGTTLADIAKREGLDEKEIRSEVTDTIRIQKLIEAKVGDVAPPTDADLKALFDEIAAERPEVLEIPEQVEASHILIKVDPEATEDEKIAARKKLEAILEDIRGGADFAQIAFEVSDCPSGKRAGGSLGSFGRGQMVKPFEDAAFSQEIGVVGDVVETDFGFHIIKVTGKTEAGTRTWESEKEALTSMYMRKTESERVEAFIEGLRNAATIEILYKPAERAEEVLACGIDGCDIEESHDVAEQSAEQPEPAPEKAKPVWVE